ncbi:MAG: response regulator transcription factor [Firmicutes bacterium]|nr:response regulator transcription factor [Bacillota bacterium]
MSTRILVVDDERPIAEILKYNLEKEGYEVILAYDGEEALALLEQSEPDLVLLDIMLPKKDGFAVCREIRSRKEIPIIMLTAKESEADKVRGLELGADDYVTKPFGAREVIARVKAALRRARSPSTGGRKQLRHGDLLVDPETMMVFNRSRPVELTPKEFSLLLVLIRRPGRIFNRQQLLNQVWGYDYFGDERTVDVTIRRLREKLESDPAAPEYIRTKRGVGYFFRQR